MGRELKRVPIDFQWPLNKVWQGYLNPHYIEPPLGDGYQLWETCSEGSPITPVFASLDDLCAYAEQHATTFGSAKTTASEWKQMLTDGLVVYQEGNVTFL